MYRYWAIGWVIYTAGAFWGVLLSSSALVITDIFSLTGLYVGATLFVDGSKGKELTKKRTSIYILGTILFLSLLFIGLTFSWPFYLVFTPLGFHISYVCFMSAKTVYQIPSDIGQPRIWLLSGLMTWGLSWLSFPLIAIIPEYYLTFMVIQAVGVVVAGASMLTLFMRTVTGDLEKQYKVTQIMSSLVQHDIRNFIQVARLALELTESSGIENDHWVGVASSSLDGAREFVDEMREIASTLTLFKPKPEHTHLITLIDSVKQRVVAEYSIQSQQVEVDIPENTYVLACRLSKELLWNIFDNSFKHGSDSVYVHVSKIEKQQVILEISDRGGGLPDDIKSFLNNSFSTHEKIASGVGLGMILIHSLAQMCEAKIHVEDITEESRVIGTKYTVHLKVSNQAT
jgi:signal transduction histidine kinase